MEKLLTFREWKAENLSLIENERTVTLKDKRTGIVIHETEKTKEIEHNPKTFLLKVYQDNFDRIQNIYQS